MEVRITFCFSLFIGIFKILVILGIMFQNGNPNDWLSDESIKPLDTSNNSLSLAINHINTKLRIKFDGG